MKQTTKKAASNNPNKKAVASAKQSKPATATHTRRRLQNKAIRKRTDTEPLQEKNKEHEDFLEYIEAEFNRALLPINLKLTKAEMKSMAVDIVRFIPHLYLLNKMVGRTHQFAFEFFEKYGQDRIIAAGNAASKKRST